MIDLSQEIILSLILRSFFTGAVLGLLYECVRVVKMLFCINRSTRGGKILLFIYLFFTDLAFCLLFAFFAILLTYNLSGGVFRGCVYVCMALGLMIYRLTLGRLAGRIERVITNIIRKASRAILRLVVIPIRAIFSLVCRLYSLTIGRIIGKIICSVRKKRKERPRASAEGNEGLLLPPSSIEGEKEEENNAKRARGYKKEDRISFGAGVRAGSWARHQKGNEDAAYKGHRKTFVGGIAHRIADRVHNRTYEIQRIAKREGRS